uniref:Uncharacterized protein n=1 Tax=Glossina palpalis gambiensis TaxID=67801 RepID=A0A1B0BPY3_9MUSC
MESDLVPGIHSKQTKLRHSNNALGQGSSTGSLATVTDWRRRSQHAVELLKNITLQLNEVSQQESLSPLSKQPVKIQNWAVYVVDLLAFSKNVILEILKEAFKHIRDTRPADDFHISISIKTDYNSTVERTAVICLPARETRTASTKSLLFYTQISNSGLAHVDTVVDSMQQIPGWNWVVFDLKNKEERFETNLLTNCSVNGRKL